MITVFTPTYNRKKDLERLYESLISQDSMEFVWVIVDDGSEDDTDKFIESIIRTSPFEIVYHYQKNAGKHTAINWLLDNCQSQFAICVDSDDYLTASGVSILNGYAAQFKSDMYWAIVGPKCSLEKGIGNWDIKMPESISFSEIYTRYKYKGETFMLWNLALFEGIRFPVFKGENFIPESAIYDILDMKSKVRICNEKIYVFSYKSDGLTNNSKLSFINNRNGYAVANLISSKNKKRPLINRSIYYGRFYAIRRRARINNETLNTRGVSKLVVMLGTLIGKALSLIYALERK